jgi:hypothetical protein
MRRFRRPNGYDAAINLFTSFRRIENRLQDRPVLENLFASLRVGGEMVMEMMGREVLGRSFAPASGRASKALDSCPRNGCWIPTGLTGWLAGSSSARPAGASFRCVCACIRLSNCRHCYRGAASATSRSAAISRAAPRSNSPTPGRGRPESAPFRNCAKRSILPHRVEGRVRTLGCGPKIREEPF